MAAVWTEGTGEASERNGEDGTEGGSGAGKWAGGVCPPRAGDGRNTRVSRAKTERAEGSHTRSLSLSDQGCQVAGPQESQDRRAELPQFGDECLLFGGGATVWVCL